MPQLTHEYDRESTPWIDQLRSSREETSTSWFHTRKSKSIQNSSQWFTRRYCIPSQHITTHSYKNKTESALSHSHTKTGLSIQSNQSSQSSQSSSTTPSLPRQRPFSASRADESWNKSSDSRIPPNYSVLCGQSSGSRVLRQCAYCKVLYSVSHYCLHMREEKTNNKSLLLKMRPQSANFARRKIVPAGVEKTMQTPQNENSPAKLRRRRPKTSPAASKHYRREGCT